MPRLDRIDWADVEGSLEEQGHAVLHGLLGARECGRLQRLYADPGRFRSFVDMARHRFGDGDYRYFADPLPDEVQQLRTGLYPPLAEIANRWQARLGEPESHPATLAQFLKRCAASGQSKPTPLLLRYSEGGFNNLHQDRYGEIAFPLQVAILLSRSPLDAQRDGRPADFEGGEFLLVEQRPRQQSRGSVVALRRGDAVIFPNAQRPVAGTRRTYRTTVRHGVSQLISGDRMTLGLIFHDAA